MGYWVCIRSGGRKAKGGASEARSLADVLERAFAVRSRGDG